MASCKVRHYFQVHNIIMPMGFPLGEILHNPDASGHIAKWALELAEFDIKFTAPTTIKSQVLADFMVKLTNPALFKPTRSIGLCTSIAQGLIAARGQKS